MKPKSNSAVVINPWINHLTQSEATECDRVAIAILDMNLEYNVSYKLITLIQIFFIFKMDGVQKAAERTAEYLMFSDDPRIEFTDDQKIEMAIIAENINPMKIGLLTQYETILMWCLYGPQSPQNDIYLYLSELKKPTDEDNIDKLEYILKNKHQDFLLPENQKEDYTYPENLLESVKNYFLSVQNVTSNKIIKSYKKSKEIIEKGL